MASQPPYLGCLVGISYAGCASRKAENVDGIDGASTSRAHAIDPACSTRRHLGLTSDGGHRGDSHCTLRTDCGVVRPCQPTKRPPVATASRSWLRKAGARAQRDLTQLSARDTTTWVVRYSAARFRPHNRLTPPEHGVLGMGAQGTRLGSTIKKPRDCRRGFLVLPGQTTKGRVGMLSHCAPLPSGGRKDSDVSRFPWCSSRRFVEANLGDRVFRHDGRIRTDAAECSR